MSFFSSGAGGAQEDASVRSADASRGFLPQRVPEPRTRADPRQGAQHGRHLQTRLGPRLHAPRVRNVSELKRMQKISKLKAGIHARTLTHTQRYPILHTRTYRLPPSLALEGDNWCADVWCHYASGINFHLFLFCKLIFVVFSAGVHTTTHQSTIRCLERVALSPRSGLTIATSVRSCCPGASKTDELFC